VLAVAVAVAELALLILVLVCLDRIPFRLVQPELPVRLELPVVVMLAVLVARDRQAFVLFTIRIHHEKYIP
jgi:hypothetical protein